MFSYSRSEIAAGVFLLFGLALLGYLSISIGGIHLGRHHRYRIVARFANVGDLKPRAPVKIAGVTVGEVKAIRLADYFAQLVLEIDREVALPSDTIASITTAGLLGEAYVALSPGAADKDMRDGDVITHTEPALNVADLLARYAFGGAGSGESPGASPTAAPDAGAAPAPRDSPTPPHKERNR